MQEVTSLSFNLFRVAPDKIKTCTFRVVKIAAPRLSPQRHSSRRPEAVTPKRQLLKFLSTFIHHPELPWCGAETRNPSRSTVTPPLLINPKLAIKPICMRMGGLKLTRRSQARLIDVTNTQTARHPKFTVAAQRANHLH